MEEFLKYLYCFTGNIYIPSFVRTKSIKILHISDTPYSIFNKIIKLVKKIEPDILFIQVIYQMI